MSQGKVQKYSEHAPCFQWLRTRSTGKKVRPIYNHMKVCEGEKVFFLKSKIVHRWESPPIQRSTFLQTIYTQQEEQIWNKTFCPDVIVIVTTFYISLCTRVYLQNWLTMGLVFQEILSTLYLEPYLNEGRTIYFDNWFPLQISKKLFFLIYSQLKLLL